jgi:deoxyxylulose-5-phosphate synthase
MAKHPLLSQLESAYDLHGMSVGQLSHLATEIRDVLCNLLEERTAHFASNLGVAILHRTWVLLSWRWPCTACSTFATIG